MRAAIGQCHWVYGGVSLKRLPHSAAGIAKLLSDLIRVINMTAISPAQIAIDDDGNVRALQLIAESHIAMHTWADHAYLSVFSCREFEPSRVQACLEIWLGGRWAREQLRADWILGPDPLGLIEPEDWVPPKGVLA